MKSSRVVNFEPQSHVLAKAQRYVESVEAFSEDSKQAVALLLRALKLADAELKEKIILTLGIFAREESLWPIYEIMHDARETEGVRNHAAIQLSVIGPLLKEPQALIDRLIADTVSSDAELRLHATFALGWEGNTHAALPLIERLYDGDDRVRQSAISALCNLRDDRILPLLRDRLEHVAADQAHAILLNLWRFTGKQPEVIETYRQCMAHPDNDVRFDAVVCFGLVTEVKDRLALYGGLLKDPDSRIRRLAIKRLAKDASDSALQSFRSEIEALLKDPDMEVKRAALKILGKTPR